MKDTLTSRALAPTVLRWKRAMWTRRRPGSTTLAFLAVVPLVFVGLPGSAEWLPSWSYVANSVLWFGSFVVAVAICRDSVLPEPAHVWLYQKGVPLGDHGLLTCLFDALLGLAILWWWVAVWALVSPYKGVSHSGADILGVGFIVSLVFLTAQVVLVVTAASGSNRGVEFLAAGALLSLYEPILVAVMPATAGQLLHVVAPPFIDIIGLREAVQSAAPRDTLHPLIHILSFWGALLGYATWRLDRWRPR